MAKLWEAAGDRIRAAEKIAWLGYSMPESDASAVEFMCNSIAQNRSTRLEIDLVLGPVSFHTDRLKHLLEAVCRNRQSLSLTNRTRDLARLIEAIEREKDEWKRISRAEKTGSGLGDPNERQKKDQCPPFEATGTRSALSIGSALFTPIRDHGSFFFRTGLLAGGGD